MSDFISRGDALAGLEAAIKLSEQLGRNAQASAYRAVLKRIEAIPAADVAPVVRWNPVECGLPAKGEYDWVLVLVKLEPDGFVGLPHIAELRRGVWYATEYEEPIEKILSAKVTHWMPLPEKASFGAIKQEADHA